MILSDILPEHDRLAAMGRAVVLADQSMIVSSFVTELLGLPSPPGHLSDLGSVLGAEQLGLLQAVVSQCSGTPLEIRLLLESGRHVEVRAQRQGEDVLCVLRDATSEVRRGDRLRELSSLLMAAERAANMGHWRFTPDDGAVHWSDGVFRIHGLPPEEGAPGFERLMTLFHPDDARNLGSLVERALAHGESYETELRVLRDGQEIWCRAKGMPHRDQRGRVTALFGVIQEIQDLRDQREHLQRLSEVVDHVAEAIVLTDAAGRIEWANKGFERITGYTVAESIGHTPGALLQGPDTDQATIERMRTARKAGVAFTEVVLNYTKRGDPYWLHISCHPRHDADGRLLGFIAIELDMTEQHHAHDALEEKRRQLEQLVFQQQRQQRELQRLLQEHREARAALEAEIQQRQRLEGALRDAALRDELTGVPNRRHFFDAAERERSRCVRHGSAMCVLMLDVDHFKHVNDEHGHAAGDEALRHVARISTETLRDIDLFARVGGEEFAVLLPQTELVEAFVVAERLRHAIATSPLALPGGFLQLTCSLGVAELDSGEDTVSEVVARADAALYRAKSTGRNRWEASRGRTMRRRKPRAQDTTQDR